jgi:hypothetical protein
VPIELSKVFKFFLKRGGKIFATVTGSKFFEFYTSLISNNCPGKQTRFLSTLKNLAAACFSFSSANLITRIRVGGFN